MNFFKRRFVTNFWTFCRNEKLKRQYQFAMLRKLMARYSIRDINLADMSRIEVQFLRPFFSFCIFAFLLSVTRAFLSHFCLFKLIHIKNEPSSRCKYRRLLSYKVALTSNKVRFTQIANRVTLFFPSTFTSSKVVTLEKSCNFEDMCVCSFYVFHYFPLEGVGSRIYGLSVKLTRQILHIGL